MLYSYNGENIFIENSTFFQTGRLYSIIIFILFKILRFAFCDYYDKLKNEMYLIFPILTEPVANVNLLIASDPAGEESGRGIVSFVLPCVFVGTTIVQVITQEGLGIECISDHPRRTWHRVYQ